MLAPYAAAAAKAASTGWLGYDFVANLATDAHETSLHAWRDGAWQAVARLPYAVNGNGLELAIARSHVGELDRLPAFDFHWADNIASFGDVSELGVNGDSAPNRRWNYRFSVQEEAQK